MSCGKFLAIVTLNARIPCNHILSVIGRLGVVVFLLLNGLMTYARRLYEAHCDQVPDRCCYVYCFTYTTYTRPRWYSRPFVPHGRNFRGNKQKPSPSFVGHPSQSESNGDNSASGLLSQAPVNIPIDLNIGYLAKFYSVKCLTMH